MFILDFLDISIHLIFWKCGKPSVLRGNPHHKLLDTNLTGSTGNKGHVQRETKVMLIYNFITFIKYIINVVLNLHLYKRYKDITKSIETF